MFKPRHDQIFLVLLSSRAPSPCSLSLPMGCSNPGNRWLVTPELKERNHGKIPFSPICAANTDMIAENGRRGLKKDCDIPDKSASSQLFCSGPGVAIAKSRPGSPTPTSRTGVGGSSPDERNKNSAAQMLLLYYVLLYESVRMSHMKSIVTSHRRVLRYSQVRPFASNRLHGGDKG